MRDWMRTHSTLWSRFDPTPAAPTFPCGFCRHPLAEAAPRHFIGTAWTKNGQHHKWCDGVETPV